MGRTKSSLAVRSSQPAGSMRRGAAGFAALLLLGLSALPSAVADEGALRVPFAPSLVSQGEAAREKGGKSQKAESVAINVSAAQAARAARREYGGKVLGVILEADARPPYYRVKLLDGGRVRVVHIAAHK